MTLKNISFEFILAKKFNIPSQIDSKNYAKEEIEGNRISFASWDIFILKNSFLGTEKNRNNLVYLRCFQ